MNRRKFLKVTCEAGIFACGALTFSSVVFGSPNQSPNLIEYCFSISSHKSIGMRAVDTTPEQFLRDNPDVEAAINGSYYGPDNKIEGIAYLADNWHFATEKPEHTRGYFSVNRKGDEIKVIRSLDGKLNDYFLVLGTHPLLVTDGKVHSQSLEDRYAKRRFYRSAIGTKTGKDICFAISINEILMSEWAKKLRESGYRGAINLDGGPVSQMAIRKRDGVSVKGKGTGNTKLVIFSYNR